MTARYPSVPQFSFLALLDTGAPWTLINAELADELELFSLGGLEPSTRTAQGLIRGTLTRVNLELVASEGRSAAVDATILVSRDWAGPNILGLTGFLERLRFGLDPAVNEFHFGPVP